MSVPASRWLGLLVAVGVLYAVIGVVFGRFSAGAATHSLVVFWRLAAWIASGVVFGAHILYELHGFRHRPVAAALHAALASALGACGLAIAATLHNLAVHSGNRLIGLSILVWPAITAIPAFLVAFVTAALAARLWPAMPAQRPEKT